MTIKHSKQSLQRRRRVFWADLHNHNEVGYGQGDLVRSYEIARSSLDVYAFTPHGWWPDISDRDQAIKRYHLAGFAKVKEQWDNVVSMANRMYDPGSFVSFIAYEWHSLGYGDYCVYFPGEKGCLYRANDAVELKSFAADQNALMLPHHCAYALGSRGTDWSALDERLSPVAEIFSEHGNSLEVYSYPGMYGHSMGGSQKSQTVLEQLCRGHKIGFIAGTDDHYGYPGSFGEGLTGILATEATRGAVLDAIKARHTYAVTGDRIELNFRLANGIMGDVLPASVERTGTIDVLARNEIDHVELIKNGCSLKIWAPSRKSQANASECLVTMEWGWGPMNDSKTTIWDFSVKVSGGRIQDVSSGFCGGPDILKHRNHFDLIGPQELLIHSLSNRTNFVPTQRLTFKVEGADQANIEVCMKGRYGADAFARCFSHTLGQLCQDDSYVSISEAMSAPRIRCHAAGMSGGLRFSQAWQDENSQADDFYYVKVVQKNGHCAWSSPIWCTNGYRQGDTT